MKLYNLYINESQIVIDESENLKYIMIIDDHQLLYNDINLFQKTLFVEMKDRDHFYFMNPITGLFLSFTNPLSLSTRLNTNCYIKWIKMSDKWVIDKNDKILPNDVFIKHDNLKKYFRIFWNKSSIQQIIQNMPKDYYFDHLNNLNFQDYCTQSYVKQNYKQIMDREKAHILSDLIDKKNKLIITAGSQAGGKSTIMGLMNLEKFYEVDSDRYIQMYSGVSRLNNLPIVFENIDNVINSYLESDYFLSIFKDSNHKSLEYYLSNFCIEHNANFIKQGTSLYLDHIIQQHNLPQYKIKIICVWINQLSMLKRLSNRLLDKSALRYYYSPQLSINSYNSDWFDVSNQIVNIHLNYILSNKFKIEIICNDLVYCSKQIPLFNFTTRNYSSSNYIFENYTVTFIILLLLKVYKMSDLSFELINDLYQLNAANIENIQNVNTLQLSINDYVDELSNLIKIVKEKIDKIKTLPDNSIRNDIDLLPVSITAYKTNIINNKLIDAQLVLGFIIKKIDKILLIKDIKDDDKLRSNLESHIKLLENTNDNISNKIEFGNKLIDNLNKIFDINNINRSFWKKISYNSHNDISAHNIIEYIYKLTKNI